MFIIDKFFNNVIDNYSRLDYTNAWINDNQQKEIKKEDDMMPLSMIAEGQPSVIKK